MSAPTLVQEHVAKYLRRLWQQQTPRKIGLAISGGVDSMALATLCTGSRSGFLFTGFIVDHNARKDSSDEAANVAEELRKIGIEPRILQLDWSTHGTPTELTNFEAVARKLRYQAIGKACHVEGIRSLFVGHHADDQAETVLTRIVSGYLGAGLAGIQTEAGIPECAGIYGVDGSGGDFHRSQLVGQEQHDGFDGMLIEKGGVNICRPLLLFTKSQLVQICQDEKVRWFDDPTNADRMLTIRNTIRHLHERDVLPNALRRSRLCSMALAARTRTVAVQSEVDRIFDTMAVELDLRLGKVVFTVDHNVIEKCSHRSSATMYRIKATLLRKLMQLVTNRSILLQDLGSAVDVVFSRDAQFQAMQVGKVSIQAMSGNDHNEGGHKTIVLSRQRPNASDVRMTSQLAVLDQNSDGLNHPTDWILWDGRYWLRLQYKGHHTLPDPLCISVRFFTPSMLGSVRNSLDKQQRLVLDQHLKAAKLHGVIWTLTVLVAQHNDGEYIVSLPSLRWENPAFRKWYAEKSGTVELPFNLDTRYISVDFEKSEKHQIIS